MKGRSILVCLCALLCLCAGVFIGRAAVLRESVVLSTEEGEPPPVSDTLGTVPAQPVQEDGKLNVNTATADELSELPGIGAVMAKRIVDYRMQNGAFQSVDELLAVKGIGEATLERFRSYLKVEEGERP